MPGWRKAARQWVADGRLAILGITQEQHAERCRLFAQWQRIDWPILHDPVNVLQTTGVPIVMAIDEHGIVRKLRPRAEDFERDFLDQTFSDDAGAVASSLTPSRDLTALRKATRLSGAAPSWRQLGDSLTIWHTPQLLDEAISAYQSAIRRDAADLDARFRLGVCFRMRHETEQRQDGDFDRAIKSWEEALEGRPNLYIWRRRIQQYGPRLMKPYPFYDWVTRAQAEVRQRGQTPVSLPVSPSGAEIAHPSRTFTVVEQVEASPDPSGAIQRDRRPLIDSAVTIVPSVVKPGETARVHVTLAPHADRRAHWNNEVEPLKLWIDPPEGWRVTKRLLSARRADRPETKEVRRLDFEVQVPKDAAGPGRLSSFALYYVCEDLGGTCLFLRKDIPIEVPVRTK